MDELRRIRKERGLSQAKLAALSGLDPSTVNQIERGARKPGTASLERLAEALGVEVADLFRGYELPPKSQASLFEEDGQRRSLESPGAVRNGYARIIDAWAEHIRVRTRSWDPGALGLHALGRDLTEKRAHEESLEILGTSEAILDTVKSEMARAAPLGEDVKPLVGGLLVALFEMNSALGRIGQAYEPALLLRLTGFVPEKEEGESAPRWAFEDPLLRHVNDCSDLGCEICHPSEGPAWDLEELERRAASLEELPRSAAS